MIHFSTTLGIMILGIGEPPITMDIIHLDIIIGMDIEIIIGDGNIQDTIRIIHTTII